MRIAIVAAQFNEFIAKDLLKGCLDELKKAGLKNAQIVTVWVPGSLEVPLAALKLARKKNVDAVICLGAVIRGETYHFEVVSNESARGMMNVGLSTGKPVINGILTADTIGQAQKHARAHGDNKGRDCARAALDMTALLKQI